jgi:hypothetical protein
MEDSYIPLGEIPAREALDEAGNRKDTCRANNLFRKMTQPAAESDRLLDGLEML